MFAILEKRIVAGIVASLSLVANLAVFVFLGVVGPIILNVTSISMMQCSNKNFKIDLFVKMHRQLPLLLFTPGCPTSSTPPMLSFSYPGVTIISLDMIFVNCNVFINSGLSLTTICLKNRLTPYGLYFRCL